MSELLNELSTNINKDLVRETLEHYTELKMRFRLGDLLPAAEAAGRFAESTLKCLLYFNDRTITSRMGLSFEPTYQKIMNIPNIDDTLDEYKFRLIPQVAKDVYTIRNKKEVAHARGEKLLFIDLLHIIQACDWIIASLLFVSHRVNDDIALQMMVDIMELDTPLIQEIGDYFVITTTRLNVEEALLILLYRYGRKVKQAELVKNLRLQFAKNASYDAIKRLNKIREVFLNPDDKKVKLLPSGRARAERIAIELQKRLVR